MKYTKISRHGRLPKTVKNRLRLSSVNLLTVEGLFPDTGKNTEQSFKGKKHRRSKTEILIRYQVGYSEKCRIQA